jgi:hypothetical protein
MAALVSLSALESTLSGSSACSSLKVSATGGCFGEVMKAPVMRKASGPVSEPRNGSIAERQLQASSGELQVKKRWVRLLGCSLPVDTVAC